jgi:predicted ATPase
MEMSSGHSFILLTIIQLIRHTEEKTLVLIDEPENHLHPPMLSGFIRAISAILLERNAVSVLATHSPVVLQEVPRACVSILARTGDVCKVEKPEFETFAESIGVLTHEIFNLESRSTGYHELIMKSAKLHDSDYDLIMGFEYAQSLGFEGRTLLRSLCANKK